MNFRVFVLMSIGILAAALWFFNFDSGGGRSSAAGDSGVASESFSAEATGANAAADVATSKVKISKEPIGNSASDSPEAAPESSLKAPDVSELAQDIRQIKKQIADLEHLLSRQGFPEIVRSTELSDREMDEIKAHISELTRLQLRLSKLRRQHTDALYGANI